MKKRDYRDYINDILESINDIENFVAGMNYEDFKEDRKTINATVRSIEIIGEASKKIFDSLKSKFPAIPWKEMVGMRNKLIHEYFGVDIDILWQTIKEDLSSLKPLIVEIKQYLEKESKE
jgi:uncharacterized protein with HEPN domain